jgi:6-pyruvoyltetrahydropterin/6-carboxytetrahydropterin synthase
MYEVTVEKTFPCTHALRDYKGSSEFPHRHEWKVEVTFRGPELIRPEGYLVDFVEMQAILDSVLDKISGKNLNEMDPFTLLNPSAENVARWILEQFACAAPEHAPAKVRVWETPECSASFIPG